MQWWNRTLGRTSRRVSGWCAAAARRVILSASIKGPSPSALGRVRASIAGEQVVYVYWITRVECKEHIMAAIEALKWILGRPVRMLKIVGAVAVGMGAAKLSSP